VEAIRNEGDKENAMKLMRLLQPNFVFTLELIGIGDTILL
jgi:hypothetical protein